MSQMKTPVNTKKKQKSSVRKVLPIVPKHRRDASGQAQKMGYWAETHFKASCESKNFKWENASKEENCNQHIDCHVTTPKGMKFTVDVKAAKKIARGDRKPQDKWTWIEWTARDGRPGWARSNVDFIAFAMLNGSFLLVKTEELKEYVEPMIEKYKRVLRLDSQRDAKNGLLWRRNGNKDAMTLIATDELALLPNSFFL